VAVARADGEAEPPIQLGAGIEIAHGMNDMVETARHVRLLCLLSLPGAAALRHPPIYRKKKTDFRRMWPA
jgi:hypothetical protein